MSHTVDHVDLAAQRAVGPPPADHAVLPTVPIRNRLPARAVVMEAQPHPVADPVPKRGPLDDPARRVVPDGGSVEGRSTVMELPDPAHQRQLARLHHDRLGGASHPQQGEEAGGHRIADGVPR